MPVLAHYRRLQFVVSSWSVQLRSGGREHIYRTNYDRYVDIVLRNIETLEKTV
jgi:hypothetical protein